MASKELRLNGQGLPRESQNQTGLRRERNLQRILQRAASEASLRFPLIGSWPRSPVEAEMNCPSHYLKPGCGESVCLLFLCKGWMLLNESFNYFLRLRRMKMPQAGRR